MDATPGKAVKTTTVREVVPANQDKQRSTPEFWGYLEALKTHFWNDHLLYI